MQFVSIAIDVWSSKHTWFLRFRVRADPDERIAHIRLQGLQSCNHVLFLLNPASFFGMHERRWWRRLYSPKSRIASHLPTQSYCGEGWRCRCCRSLDQTSPLPQVSHRCPRPIIQQASWLLYRSPTFGSSVSEISKALPLYQSAT